jgi:hypothetical protein
MQSRLDRRPVIGMTLIEATSLSSIATALLLERVEIARAIGAGDSPLVAICAVASADLI